MQGNSSSLNLILFTIMSNKTKDLTRVVLDHVENNVFCFYVKTINQVICILQLNGFLK